MIAPQFATAQARTTIESTAAIVPPRITLSSRDLSIHFGGHVAVNSVSADFHAGELTVIVGPNGAGKTTYFNLLSGQLMASAGQIFLAGRDITHQGAAARTRMGIGRGFQLTNLFPHLSVLENVRLAAQSKANKGFRLLSIWSDHAELIERAESYLEQVSLYHRRHEQTAILSHGDKRKLEVALMLALEPEILMFDEPTAGMSVDEVPVIINLIQKIKQDQQKTVLLVEHKMDVVRSLADRIMVLQDGCLVADGEPNAVMASDAVQQAYLGKRTSPPQKMENNPIT